MNCPKCQEELSNTEGNFDDIEGSDDFEDSFVVKHYECSNEKCELKGKEILVFYDYSRVEVDGEEI